MTSDATATEPYLAVAGLLRQVEMATGADKQSDRAIAMEFRRSTTNGEAPDYTASVDRCVDLIKEVMPGWSWHVGFGASGIFPYALVRDATRRFEAQALTVPLALLCALLKPKVASDSETGSEPR